VADETTDKKPTGPDVAPAPTNLTTPGEQARADDAQAKVEEKARADAPPRTQTVVTSQLNQGGQTVAATVTNKTTIVGGTKDDDNGVKANTTVQVGQQGQVTGAFNVTAANQQTLTTPVGDVTITAESDVGGRAVNGRLRGTFDNTVQATRDIAGDSDTTGIGVTARVEHSHDGQQAAAITGDPFNIKANGVVTDAGVNASVQQKFGHVTLTGTGFGGVEYRGRTGRSYAETTIGVDGSLPSLKHRFRNGVEVGAMDTRYHGAGVATTRGSGWEASVSSTIVKSKAGNVETRYQRSGGTGSSTFGADTGVPNNGFTVSYHPHMPSLRRQSTAAKI